MDVNQVIYGNPSADTLDYINGQSFMDGLFSELSGFCFPTNGSQNTKEELNQLLQKSKQIIDKEDIKRFRLYDRSIYNYFCSKGFKDEQDTNTYRTTVYSIFEDVLPLVFKLKMHHQRPRPFQLAGFYKFKLFPTSCFSVHSPSFPSMHACVAKVIAEVCGNHYPALYQKFQDIAQDVAKSRLYLGVNYQSDIDAGLYTADKIINEREFKIKYKL